MSKGFLVPGWGSDARVFEPLMAHLDTESWGIIEYHRSDDPTAEFLTAIKDSQNSHPAVAVGWSLGGMLLLNHREALSSSIKHLVLISVPSQFCNDETYDLNQPPAVLQAMSRRAERNLTRELKRFYTGSFAGERGAEPSYPGTAEQHTDNALQGLELIGSFSALTTAKHLNLPITLIAGQRDPICLPQAVEHLHSLLPQSELITGDWGHLPFYDAPQEIANILTSCLESASIS